MDRSGRISLLVLLLVFMLALAGCSRVKRFDIQDAAVLELMSGTTGERVRITDEAIIGYITDNINAPSFTGDAQAGIMTAGATA